MVQAVSAEWRYSEQENVACIAAKTSMPYPIGDLLMANRLSVRSIVAAMLISICGFGCTGIFRDNRGTVHDSHYNAQEAKGLVTQAPLLIPFVPIGTVGNGIKASIENGRITVSGTVVDEAEDHWPAFLCVSASHK
jgi:hypothetical protein